MTKNKVNFLCIFALVLTFLAVATVFAGCSDKPDVNPGTEPGTATPVAVESVSLSESTKTMVVGEEFQFVAIISPTNATNKNVTWKCSIPNGSQTVSAMVSDNGKVTAIAVGKAILTVTSVENSELSAQCEIIVNPAPVKVESVVISNYNTTDKVFNLTIGTSADVTAQVLPENADNKNLEWSVEPAGVVELTPDASTLKVELTALTIGEAVVTATSKDGSKTASFKVVVPAINLTSILIANDETSEKLNELSIKKTSTNSFALNVAVEPKNTTDTFEVVIPTEYANSISVDVTNGTALKSVSQINVTIDNAIEGTFDLIFRSKQTPSVSATVHLTIANAYAKVGESRFDSFAEAYNAVTTSDTVIKVRGALTVDAPIVINDSKWVSIQCDDEPATITASENFVGANLLEVNSTQSTLASELTFKNLILDASNKARVVYIHNDNKAPITLDAIEVLNGHVEVDVNSITCDTVWAPGIWVDGISQVTMHEVVAKLDKNSDSLNKVLFSLNNSVYANTARAYYTRDLCVGARAYVRLAQKCVFGRALKKTNYTTMTADNSEIFVGNLVVYENEGETTISPRIDTVYLEYDEYGQDEIKSIKSQGTGVIGAVLRLWAGAITNLILEDSSYESAYISKLYKNPYNGENPYYSYTDNRVNILFLYQAGKDPTSLR